MSNTVSTPSPFLVDTRVRVTKGTWAGRVGTVHPLTFSVGSPEILIIESVSLIKPGKIDRLVVERKHLELDTPAADEVTPEPAAPDDTAEGSPVRALYARLAREYEAEPTVPDHGGGLPGDRFPLL